MKEQITVQAHIRDEAGTSAAGRLRRSGKFPAILYGKGQPGIRIRVDRHGFELMLHRHHSEHMMLDLAIEGGETHRVLLKDVQHHAISGDVIHADFQKVALDERLRVEVPIELTGEPVGVSRGGGVLEHLLRTVEVECLPADLIEEIAVDVQDLDVGQHLAVSAIRLDTERYRIVTAPDIAIATVSAPRVDEDAAAEGDASAEPALVKAPVGEEKESD